MIKIRGASRAWLLVVALLLGGNVAGQVTTATDDIARAIVIGQAYVSGNVYVAGFVEDEPRSWPQRIEGVPLDESRRERVAADFFRAVAQDSEEHYYFPQREGDPADDDVFTTVDKAAIQDRNIARYRAPVPVDRSIAFFGWDTRLRVADISYRAAGQARPVTAEERKEIDSRKAAAPKDVECTTVPRYLDDAKIILTASVDGAKRSIRLSKYTTPGCAGHLADIYVLDVMTPGEMPRRFEFLHYQGVI